MYGFADSSDGAVTVESQLDVGTRVTIYLPHTDKAKSDAGPNDAGNRSQPLVGRILLVDDNSEVASVTETMLSAMGLQVETTNQAREALERLAVEPNGFRLLLTDVVMPGMNGVDLAREVRVRLPRLPIILMSGYNDGLPVAESEFQILRKPIPYGELYDVIRTHLVSGVHRRA